jgi:hypothetical protein
MKDLTSYMSVRRHAHGNVTTHQALCLSTLTVLGILTLHTFKAKLSRQMFDKTSSSGNLSTIP